MKKRILSIIAQILIAVIASTISNAAIVPGTRVVHILNLYKAGTVKDVLTNGQANVLFDGSDAPRFVPVDELDAAIKNCKGKMCPGKRVMLRINGTDYLGRPLTTCPLGTIKDVFSATANVLSDDPEDPGPYVNYIYKMTPSDEWDGICE